jgi:LysM repeat protein
MNHFTRMKPAHRRFCPWLFLAAVVAVAPLHAGAQDISAIIAGLREDIRILDERTRSLTAEIEQLKRENRGLREQAASGQYVTLAQFNSSLAELERALRAGDRELALQLTQQMERMAKQTQAAIDTVAKAAGSRAPTQTIQFTSDFPATGTTYVVQPGDTLSSIAQRFGSAVRDIQNANKIADATKLQVGQTLFIPQKQP